MKRVVLSLLTSAVAVGAYAAPQTTSTNVVMPKGAQSTLSAPVEAVAPTKSKIGLAYTAENSVDTAGSNKGNWDSANSQQNVTISYDLGNDKSIAYKQYFMYNMTEADSRQTDEWSLADHVIQFTDAKALKIGDADVSNYARLYAPGSEYAREVGKYELRLVQAVKQKPTAKTTIEYGLNSRFYAYAGDDDAQRGFRVLPAVQVEYEANKVVTPFAGVYTDHSWRHQGTGKAMFGPKAGQESSSAGNTNEFYMDLGSNFNIAEGAQLSLYLESGENMDAAGNFDLTEDNNNSYNLTLSVSM